MLNKKIGFVVSCYNKVDDLLAHLDIFKFYPFEHEIIVIHSMDLPPEYKKEVYNGKYHVQQINAIGHYIGPLLCATAGVRKAHELGLDYVCYRNCDDWLFSYQFEQDNFNILEQEKYLCAGYSWIGVGVNYDITLNEVYFHVPSFYKTVDDAESYFKRSPKGFICEYKLPRWIKKTCDMTKQFYRIPGREQEPGIGWERHDIHKAFASKGLTIPIGFWERYENNNRFFNLKWQLIGSHDVGARLNYWRKIRKVVPYGRQIEKEKHFARFIDAARHNKPWNLPCPIAQDGPIELVYKRDPKIFNRKIF